MRDKDDNYWQSKLSPEQYRILRERGTEAPFTGELLENHGDGVYKCAGCGQELFKSDDKFDSGSGWPSFDKAMDEEKVELVLDESHGMRRVEVICNNCGGHLGHVFDDGPTDTGKRYCINSCSLEFEDK